MQLIFVIYSVRSLLSITVSDIVVTLKNFFAALHTSGPALFRRVYNKAKHTRLFLVLNSSLKSSPCKFSKHVDNQKVHIKDKNEGQLFLTLFHFSI